MMLGPARGLTEGSWVVVEVAQSTNGMLMLCELHKAQAPRARQAICWVDALWIPQYLGLLYPGLCFGGMLLHLDTHMPKIMV